MCEFMTTNGDVYILPYLNKFDKLTVAQGTVLEKLSTNIARALIHFHLDSSSDSLILYSFDLFLASTSFNSTVNSQQLFSSIVNAIKDVSAEAKSSTSTRQSIKDIRRGQQTSASSASLASAAEEESKTEKKLAGSR